VVESNINREENAINVNSPVGFFDSGVGGLSVYAKFKSLLPNENTIYFGDLKNLPYGNKTKEELISFARNILDFFKLKGVKAVVIACNTSSALAYETIKEEYDFKIYPIIQSSAKLVASLGARKIGVFATVGTVSSGAYKTEILKHRSDIEVKEIACPNWVGIVEGVSDVDSDLDIKEHIDAMLKFSPDKIVLGCTHYPYLMEKLEKYAPKTMFIDPAGIFSVYIKEDLRKLNLLTPSIYPGREEFYVSAKPEAFVENAKLFYEVSVLPEVV
jgi:glutamate racemase